ncbi:hypothetical protein B1L11_41435 [Microbispora sp. GKU 823]|nr:hypothetical protein B1L11_41435 [Microbispora sp. GKU 823]
MLSTSARWRASSAGSPPASPSARVTWTASRSAPFVRAAMRAARLMRVSPSGPPVSATTTLVCASSSTRTIFGARAMTASTSSSVKVAPL